jgi:hypothetical protein
MKYLAIIIWFNLVSVFTSHGQINKNIWSFKDENYDLVFNFENEVFKVDTFVTEEGHAYIFTFPNDSSYIRLNYIFANTRFKCCENDSVYKEIERCIKNGITDRRGMIVGSTLFWRAIRDHNLDIIYNYCPKDKVEYFNRILDTGVNGKLKPILKR